MTRFQLITALFLTLTVTIAAGTLHGRLSGRWGVSTAVTEAVASLESLPERFGDWTMEESSALDAESLRQLAPYGYLNRTYVNEISGQRVSFFVLMGPVGQTVVHTPGVCYSARDYEIPSEPEPTTVQGADRRKHELWAMTLQSKSLEGGLLRVYYGWSDGTRWEATENGRFKYAGLPYLYKIQLASALPSQPDLEKDDTCRQFLTDLLPVLREKMIPASK